MTAPRACLYIERHNNHNHSHKGVYVAHVVVETSKNVIIKTLIIDIIIIIENDRSFMLMS